MEPESDISDISSKEGMELDIKKMQILECERKNHEYSSLEKICVDERCD